jgi:hypothetical protein
LERSDVIGALIRQMCSRLYTHPSVPEDVAGPGPFGRLKIALVADYFTTACLSAECRIRSLTPQNYEEVIRSWRPDFIFVESAFHGHQQTWRYLLARQPKLFRLGPPKAVGRLLALARDLGIPAVFWNKDDGSFFEDFIDLAKSFDHVFTTDAGCVERYRQCLPAAGAVHVLSMPYQPAFHFFSGFSFTRREACFAGSYYKRILGQRRQFLDMIFGACEDSSLRLNVFDRNHGRFSRWLEFEFPAEGQLVVHPGVPYPETSALYKSHAVSLNVNSVTDSGTMCSRRLLEILACGGIAVTNRSPAVDLHFRDYCHVVETRAEAGELFARLKHGPSLEDLERAEAGAAYVRSAHTWEHRLEELSDKLPI